MTNLVEVTASKNGGHTFTDWRQRNAGETGDFLTPLIYRHWGSATHMVFRMRVTGDFRANVIAVSIQMREG